MEDRPLGPFAVVVAHGVLIAFVFVLAWLLDEYRSRLFLWALLVGIPAFALGVPFCLFVRSFMRRRRRRLLGIAISGALLALLVTFSLCVVSLCVARPEGPRSRPPIRRARWRTRQSRPQYLRPAPKPDPATATPQGPEAPPSETVHFARDERAARMDPLRPSGTEGGNEPHPQPDPRGCPPERRLGQMASFSDQPATPPAPAAGIELPTPPEEFWRRAGFWWQRKPPTLETFDSRPFPPGLTERSPREVPSFPAPILPTDAEPDNPAPTGAEGLLPALDRQEQPSFFSDEPSDRDPLKDFLQKYPRRPSTSSDPK